jgi:uncharacterized membrane protein/predicted DsbA family dithiol-disulfide isomerase
MRSRISLLLLRIAALVGLAMSAAMHADYLRPVSAFCEAGSGCDQVRASHFSHLLGMPVPVIGIAGFSILIALSLARHPKGRMATLIAALGGAAAAIAFLAIQAFQIHAFCKLCVIVDTAAIVAGVAALVGYRTDVHRSDPAWPWVAAMVLWAVLPLAWARALPPPPVPPQISALWKPDTINVVEFADFECPYCRLLHPLLTEVMGAYAGRVHLTRLNMPLGSHQQARDAARAYCCADSLGKGDSMADALFSANDISQAGCERIAASLGLSLSTFEACVGAAKTDQRIESDIQRFKSSNLRGLPAVFIGRRLLIGMQSIETLRDAFATAAALDGQTGLLRALTWLLRCLGAVVTAVALALPVYAFRRARQ